MNELAEDFVLGLGGAENIIEAVPAYTRIRIEVGSIGAVNEDLLRAAGAHGVVRQKHYIQLIVGPSADELARAICDLIVA
ncbi:PTS sugar transporter [Arcanobacterium haemolyticum]|uniref:Phosphotransferase system PTS EIIB protein n=1 Tax=Arcanobacterium haemolyticum (strain ATCC 9345 / DSM 20595 / CCM 5947 / CCUG 17215 / LMG 16163 / NBRC 15585 / NCTC 8452 / 11018) TaxID=644284 RepID=D7BMR9_ARCHD|nr:PTS transporter subunit EIIB [Arcanobacterium haemolyticum]ADH92218.1 phosphotransferase system PTS EIIB protein [Arcanobacterium haemolyticum DSM 20595]QCX46371.1 PTS sugar transporter [Arcanobacterium haemolyticum]SPT75762.1 PTS system glucose-specific transporter subunits IIBC [Arcanobacterium haemolyticum]SQH29071.1 PTS system glucose-specific transporter subunits IIBC [Arcanobacterium haemolyticum]